MPLPRPVRCSGAVAQLGERLNGIQEVDGSIPFGSTNEFNRLDRPRLSVSPSAMSTPAISEMVREQRVGDGLSYVRLKSTAYCTAPSAAARRRDATLSHEVLYSGTMPSRRSAEAQTAVTACA